MSIRGDDVEKKGAWGESVRLTVVRGADGAWAFEKSVGPRNS